MPSPRLFGLRFTWTVVLLLALVAVYGVGSVKPQKNIDKKSTKVTNPNALAHMNVKAKFGARAPSFEASGSTKGNAKGPATWVRSSLSQLKVGGNSPLNVTGLNWGVRSNGTGDGSETFVYSASLGTNKSVEHTYGFHAVASQGDFSGLAFNISEGAIKWSINLTSSAVSRSEGITLRYILADNKSYAAANDNVTTFYNSPRDNMTTYVLPLTATSSSSSSLAFAEVQVFDVALVDEELQAIRHYVEAVPLASGAHQYELVLEFPPFNRSVYYDPSLSLGVLVGDQEGSGSGDDNTALVVAVSVVVVVAVVVVVVAAVGGVVYGYRRKTHHKKRMNRVQKTLSKESQLASDRV